MGRDAPISNPLICKQPSIQQQHGRVDRQGNNNGSKQKNKNKKELGNWLTRPIPSNWWTRPDWWGTWLPINTGLMTTARAVAMVAAYPDECCEDTPPDRDPVLLLASGSMTSSRSLIKWLDDECCGISSSSKCIQQQKRQQTMMECLPGWVSLTSRILSTCEL